MTTAGRVQLVAAVCVVAGCGASTPQVAGQSFATGNVTAISTTAAASSLTPTTLRSLPSALASPVSVTAAYLGAAKGHDCVFTRELTVPDRTFAWCNNPRPLDYRSIGTAALPQGVATALRATTSK